MKIMKKLAYWIGFNKTPTEPAKKIVSGVFSTDELIGVTADDPYILAKVNELSFRNIPNVGVATKDGVTFDSSLKKTFVINQTTINGLQLYWYAQNTFIGYQACGIIAQHWLVNKACSIPAQDAVRKGFDITKNDGEKLPPEMLQAITRANKKFRLKKNLVEYLKMGRVFGIRIALFLVDVPDKIAYYENPFNPDAITPGSYRGISQVDPYWITPELDADAAGNPSSQYFYEPTWWRVNSSSVGSLKVHRTHLVIMRHAEVVDVLKPTYYYGGVSLPQQIHERVYAAERVANEAPLIALTKRSTVMSVDLDQAMLNPGKFTQRMTAWAQVLSNFGLKLIGKKETIEQFDTALADLDDTISNQFQLVAAVAGVPVTKLLGTSPKGFNATGEFDEANYHEELESLQETHLTPLVERHLMLVIRSEIAPQEPFGVDIKWKLLDAMTAKEQGEVNKLKAEAGAIAIQSGAISPGEERARLIADPDSGYNGLIDEDLINEPEPPSDPNTVEPPAAPEEENGQAAFNR